MSTGHMDWSNILFAVALVGMIVWGADCALQRHSKQRRPFANQRMGVVAIRRIANLFSGMAMASAFSLLRRGLSLYAHPAAVIGV